MDRPKFKVTLPTGERTRFARHDLTVHLGDQLVMTRSAVLRIGIDQPDVLILEIPLTEVEIETK